MILSIYKKIGSRCRPEDIAYRLSDQPYVSFLDSSLPMRHDSRMSYLSWDPVFVIRSKGVKNELIDCKKDLKVFSYLNPIGFIRQVFAEHVSEDGKRKPACYYLDEKKGLVKEDKKKLSFRGGFMGYFSYDLKNHIERLPAKAEDDAGLFDYILSFYDFTLAFDHEEEQWYFAKNYMLREEGELDIGLFVQDAGKASDALDSAGSQKDISSAIFDRYSSQPIKKVGIHSNFTKKDYLQSVKKAKEHIHQGDVYQINLTQRFSTDAAIAPKDLYYVLRQKNPAPFSCFMTFEDFAICCSSPERFLYKEKDYIKTRPIKGTRPRGRDSAEDQKMIEALKNSEKDRAELNMIVDLERNDLGRFCEYGTVRVREHAVIEKFAKVFHSVSTVEGRIRKGYRIADILKAAFPGGSITGAPKIRAMQIIDDLEPNTRNVYTGSIGYISIDSTMDLNIAIRTVIATKKMIYYHVGGGIVEDSRPQEEYEETLHKGQAIYDTLRSFQFDNLRKDLMGCFMR